MAAVEPPDTQAPRTEGSVEATTPPAVDQDASTMLQRYTLMSQGAEARVWEGTFLGRPAVIKQRIKKQYRHPVLDAQLTGTRLKQEVRSMLRARQAGVHAPAVYNVEMSLSSIVMEQVVGQSVKQLLNSGTLTPEGVASLMCDVGRAVALLHDSGLVHGDLTTSNMMVREGDKQLVMIDFGLSFNSQLAEDKGVDLYVLERAITSTHSQMEGLFDKVLASYRQHSKQWSSVFNRFADVRLRGRKRTMVG